MDQTEIFELCESSPTLQCLDCNSFSEIGIFYCSCGRNLKYKRSPTTFEKDNDDFNLIPGYICKKNSSRGPKHGQSERQIMFFKGKDMLRKANKKKNGNHPIILSRLKADDEYRWSLGFVGIGEKENHALRPNCFGEARLYSCESSTNTKFEALGSLDKCWRTSTTSTTTPDYAAAKRECQRLRDEYMAETKQLYKPIHPSKQMRQNPNQQFEGSEDYDYVVDRKTGWKWYEEQQGNLPHTSSSSSSSWQNSSWQNWNTWWWHSSKPDEGQWATLFLSLQFRIAGT